ncbi:MAG: hypothetical protein Udaeo2_12520 [Candidatus Udaeobacter sp.]|nr:MAG: hypothetical protein Udaeo2_12520 [Candidatus Udaeobacter sp.]
MIGYVPGAIAGRLAAQEKRQILSVLVALAVIAIAAVYGEFAPLNGSLSAVRPTAFCCRIIMNWLVGLHRPRAGLLICGLALLPAAYFHLLPEIFCYLAAYPVIWLGAVRFRPSPGSAPMAIFHGVYLWLAGDAADPLRRREGGQAIRWPRSPYRRRQCTATFLSHREARAQLQEGTVEPYGG